jgi:hypothetical protein
VEVWRFGGLAGMQVGRSGGVVEIASSGGDRELWRWWQGLEVVVSKLWKQQQALEAAASFMEVIEGCGGGQRL